MDYRQGVLALTDNKEVLERLRGMHHVRKFVHHQEPMLDEKKEPIRDAHGAYVMKDVLREGYQAQFNGQFIIFFAGEQRTLPQNIADALEKSNITHLTEKCPHCKGVGSTVAGICVNCKGRKRIVKTKDEDQIMNYRILKVLRRFDALLVDPESSRPLAPVAPIEEAASAEA